MADDNNDLLYTNSETDFGIVSETDSEIDSGTVSETDYDYMMAKEHVNTIFQLLSIFKKKYFIKEQTFIPFRIKSPDINLIYVCQIQKKE